jgi:hypothetical protein
MRLPATTAPPCFALDEEAAKIRSGVGEDVANRGRPEEMREIFEVFALSPEPIEFLTIPAHEYLNSLAGADGPLATDDLTRIGGSGGGPRDGY